MPLFDTLRQLRRRYRIRVSSLDDIKRRKLKLVLRSPIIVEESAMSILPEKEDVKTFTIEPISEISKEEDVTTFTTESINDEVQPEDVIIDLPYEYSEDKGVIASETEEDEEVKTF